MNKIQYKEYKKEKISFVLRHHSWPAPYFLIKRKDEDKHCERHILPSVDKFIRYSLSYNEDERIL